MDKEISKEIEKYEMNRWSDYVGKTGPEQGSAAGKWRPQRDHGLLEKDENVADKH